jgi:putative acetyltransferase
MSDRNIKFRQIEKADNKEIAELIRRIFREFRIDRPGTVYFDPTTDDLYSLFQKPDSIYWIAEENGIMAGGCGIFPTPSLPTGCAELVKLYLASEYRGKGTGRMLMEKCFESARNMGYSQIYLESMPELKKAISLYEREGFRFIRGPMGNSGHFGCDIWMVKDL